MDRPGWNKLMQSVEAGKVSAIIVWRLEESGADDQELDRAVR
jgi:DNA invertase Pin-like site-specific DNA recombinase